MKTHFCNDHRPDFDVQISDWISAFSMETWGGPVLRVGILADLDGCKVVYRAIDGDGSAEMGEVYKFLESLGLIDFGIYNHPRFNCVYGLPEHRPGYTEKITVSCFSNRNLGAT